MTTNAMSVIAVDAPMLNTAAAPLLTPVGAPRANAVAERVIGTLLRRECLD